MNVSAAEPLFLEMEHVSVARGDTVVLHDVSLKIRRGEHIAILGPNGCGKSTLIRTITRACYPVPESGTVCRLLGKERWDLSQLRQHLGVVEASLPGERTPVTMGLDAVIAGFFSASTLWPNLTVQPRMRERAHEVLRLMEAEYLEYKLVGHMSAGQQRRIMIARALVHEPEMLLLDEPSNALDLAAQRDLRDVLRAVAARGVGILMVTHHLGDVLPEMDRVILMKDGRIVADGPKGDLLNADKLTRLYGAPVQMAERDGYLYAW